MKALVLLFSSLLVSTAAFATKSLDKIDRIECDLLARRGDHIEITPNVFSHQGKSYAAVTSYYTVNLDTEYEGVQHRKVFFYEVRESQENGVTHFQLSNDNTQFQNDREMNLFTKNFRTGELAHFVFQPGIGGYGPGGIPGSVSENKIYKCEFIR